MNVTPAEYQRERLLATQNRRAHRSSRPAVLLRLELRAALAAGVDFDSAWPAALARALDGADEYAVWREVLTATRSAWEAAYRGAPLHPCFDALSTAQI